MLTSNARPLVSMGIKTTPIAQITHAVANGDRAKITDLDINTYDTFKQCYLWQDIINTTALNTKHIFI